jgi:hypothetical protein
MKRPPRAADRAAGICRAPGYGYGVVRLEERAEEDDRRAGISVDERAADGSGVLEEGAVFEPRQVRIAGMRGGDGGAAAAEHRDVRRERAFAGEQVADAEPTEPKPAAYSDTRMGAVVGRRGDGVRRKRAYFQAQQRVDCVHSAAGCEGGVVGERAIFKAIPVGGIEIGERACDVRATSRSMGGVAQELRMQRMDGCAGVSGQAAAHVGLVADDDAVLYDASRAVRQVHAAAEPLIVNDGSDPAGDREAAQSRAFRRAPGDRDDACVQPRRVDDRRLRAGGGLHRDRLAEKVDRLMVRSRRNKHRVAILRQRDPRLDGGGIARHVDDRGVNRWCDEVQGKTWEEPRERALLNELHACLLNGEVADPEACMLINASSCARKCRFL